MPPDPITENAVRIDLSPRIGRTEVVGASPALAAETIIGTIAAIPANAVINQGVQLWGWCAFTVGTTGNAATLRIRQTNVSGTVIATTGATTVTAANLVETGCQGFDTAATIPGQVYVLTLQVAAATAGSTVSALQLFALVV